MERIGDLIDRARAEAASSAVAGDGTERDRLVRMAQEFESMLMLQMLKEMRKAGSWDNEDEPDGYGAATMLETIDVELAGHLARVQGLGLGKQLLGSLERTAQPGAPIQQDPPAEGQAAGQGLEFGPGALTSNFGWRSDPFTGAARFHRGVDIRAAYGQAIAAAAGGRVVSAGIEGGYGQTVVIEHPGGIRTRYAHLSTTLVRAGEEVSAGETVGRAGKSGRATGTHLHFEVTNAAGEALNPEEFSRLKLQAPAADFTRAGKSDSQETGR